MRNDKKYLMTSIISLCLFVIAVTGVSYAYYTYNKEVASVDLSSGTININFTKTENTSSVTAREPMSDNLGMIWSTYLEFSINGMADTEAILYELEIVPNSGNTLDAKYIKVYLTEVVNNVEIPVISPMRYTELYDSLANNGKGMYQDLITGNNDGTSKTTNKKYRLRVWVDESYKSPLGGNFSYSVYMYAINVNKNNYQKVTFNFQDGRETGLSKYVEIGESYGNLPTPYREGYTFEGWNGKNMFNKDKIDENHFIVTVNGNISNESGSNRLDDWISSDYLNVKPNTTYIKSGDVGAKSTDFFDNNINFIEVRDISTDSVFTTPNNCHFIKFNLKKTNKPYNNVQLEEGSIATSYEPYFIVSDTEVTEWNTEMKLKAIWSWNNYKYNDEVQDIEIHGGEMNNDYITLNGTSDYIDLGEITDKKEISIGATIKLDNSMLTGEHEVISNDENSGMELDISEGYVRFRIYLDGYNNFISVNSNSTLDATNVHDITGIYDGKKMKLYIDGKLDNESDITTIISTNSLSGKIKNSSNNTVMAIGGNPSGNSVTGNYLNGNIYSVRIYNYAIDELKIRSNIRRDGFLKKYNSN